MKSFIVSICFLSFLNLTICQGQIDIKGNNNLAIIGDNNSVIVKNLISRFKSSEEAAIERVTGKKGFKKIETKYEIYEVSPDKRHLFIKDINANKIILLIDLSANVYYDYSWCDTIIPNFYCNLHIYRKNKKYNLYNNNGERVLKKDVDFILPFGKRKFSFYKDYNYWHIFKTSPPYKWEISLPIEFSPKYHSSYVKVSTPWKYDLKIELIDGKLTWDENFPVDSLLSWYNISSTKRFVYKLIKNENKVNVIDLFGFTHVYDSHNKNWSDSLSLLKSLNFAKKNHWLNYKTPSETIESSWLNDSIFIWKYKNNSEYKISYGVFNNKLSYNFRYERSEYSEYSLPIVSFFNSNILILEHQNILTPKKYFHIHSLNRDRNLFKYYDNYVNISNSYLILFKKEEVIKLDKDGLEFDTLKNFSIIDSTFFRYKNNKEWIITDQSLNVKFSSQRYISHLGNHFFKFSIKNEKNKSIYGVVNGKGEKVIEPKFSSIIYDRKKGFFRVDNGLFKRRIRVEKRFIN